MRRRTCLIAVAASALAAVFALPAAAGRRVTFAGRKWSGPRSFTQKLFCPG